MKKVFLFAMSLVVVLFLGVCFSEDAPKTGGGKNKKETKDKKDAKADSSDLFSGIGRDPEGAGGINWKMQAWIGNDAGSGPDAECIAPKEWKGKDANCVPFLLKSEAADRLVYWVKDPSVQLKPGKTYTMSTWLKLEGVKGYTWLIAAVRCGGVQDVRGKKIFGEKDWAEYSIEFSVEEECMPAYFAIDLWGPGKVWVGPIKLSEK